jgi:hypothetical protein
VKKLPVIGVLHLPHPAELLHPRLNPEILFGHELHFGHFALAGQPCGFSAQPFWESLF